LHQRLNIMPSPSPEASHANVEASETSDSNTH
jgi:hypothetical protein